MLPGTSPGQHRIQVHLQCLTGHNGGKDKFYQSNCFDMFGGAQHSEDTPGQSTQGTHPSRWHSASKNESVLYVPYDNYRNRLREAKYQRG